MAEPVYYIVSNEQVGGDDIQEFLRRAIHKQFEGKECYIAKEEYTKRITHYSKTPRILRGFMINEGNSEGHAIWFDVTDVKNITWQG